MNRGASAVVLVGVTVSLNIASAVLLKEAAGVRDLTVLSVSLIVFLVAAVNLIRMRIWGIIHQRFSLSYSYLLSSIFFPCILAISFMYGESIDTGSLVGAALITVGVMILVTDGGEAKA